MPQPRQRPPAVFHDAGDYAAFERALAATLEGLPPAPADWLSWVNEPQTDAELEALRESVRRGRPFGAADWQTRAAEALGLQSTFRRRGWPKNSAR